MKKIILIILIVCGILVAMILGLVGLAVYLNYRETAPLSEPPAHGTSFIIQADLSKVSGNTNVTVDLKDSLKKRFSELGARFFMESVSESQIRIVAAMTNKEDVEKTQSFISHGYLEFRMVKDDSDEIIRRHDSIPSGYELLKKSEINANGQTEVETVIVKIKPENGLAGKIIKNAFANDNAGKPVVDFELNAESAAKFAELTRENVGHRLAIVLDGELYSAPIIQSPIETGSIQLTGNFDSKETVTLANALAYPLPVPITILEVKTF